MNPEGLPPVPDPNAQPWQKQPPQAPDAAGAPAAGDGTGSLLDAAGQAVSGAADLAGGAIELAGGAIDAAGTVIEGAGGCLEGCGSCSLALLIGLFLSAGVALAAFK